MMPNRVTAVSIMMAALISAPAFAQDPQQPYPQQQQYPQQPAYPQNGQYPPQNQYPQQAAPYPPQGQYPQQAAPYPPQGQYPQQPAYPQGGPYPPPQASYPPPQAPPYFPPQELDRLVSRIALYPDPLLAQVIAAATFPDQIPQAAAWADQHHYLTGPALASAIQADQLPWDPSVQALLPFPNVLAMMASDPAWTRELGDASLAQQPQLMDAVQRERQKAYSYGYLRSNGQILVTPGPYIAISPVNPGFIVVPYYNPAVVFFPPRRGIVVGTAIGFNFGISLGVAFRPWGWGGFNRIDWGGHALFINDARWGRTWANRGAYVHPGYAANLRHFAPAGRPGIAGRPAESHQLEPRNEQERKAWQTGRGRQEEHREEHH